ncbi:hypothetical protein BJV74DRAFT_351338 [Russula compacta]|nr:hypothetical protein BJV74DRAFT_351338 [Russula compacta]
MTSKQACDECVQSTLPCDALPFLALMLPHQAQPKEQGQNKRQGKGEVSVAVYISVLQPNDASTSAGEVHPPSAVCYPKTSLLHLLLADYPGLMSLDDSAVLGDFGEGAYSSNNAIITYDSGSSHNPSRGYGPTPRANPHDALPANGKRGTQQQRCCCCCCCCCGC